jgi:hypothetical protein
MIFTALEQGNYHTLAVGSATIPCLTLLDSLGFMQPVFLQAVGDLAADYASLYLLLCSGSCEEKPGRIRVYSRQPRPLFRTPKWPNARVFAAHFCANTLRETDTISMRVSVLNGHMMAGKTGCTMLTGIHKALTRILRLSSGN